MSDREPRFHRLGQDAVCDECNSCVSRTVCNPARVQPRPYSGIRFTNDGNDCALPVSIDSHSICSFGCAYCFAENCFGHQGNKERPLGETSLDAIERIFSGGGGKDAAMFRRALKYDRRNADGFPCPVQLGAVNDPCDNIERQQGWLLDFIKLACKYDQPVRISTKGTLLATPEYQAALAVKPHLFWVAFSIITPDDELSRKVEVMTPPSSERLKAMKAVTDVGCVTSLRFRPVIPGMADRTPRYPRAYETLINLAADAGATSVQYEVVYLPTRFDESQRARWEKMERDIGVPLKKLYQAMGKSQSALRPSAMWIEDIMHAIRDVAKSRGMSVGISDASWKQLNDSGCCCAMLPDDPVFGNWERNNGTEALLVARDNPDHVIRFSDTIPEWADEVLMSKICAVGGVGPKAVQAKRRLTYRDDLLRVWEDLKSTRNPNVYFQGALEPVTLEDGTVGFRYKGLERKRPDATPFWAVAKDNDAPE